MKTLGLSLFVILLTISFTSHSSDLDDFFKKFEVAAKKKDKKALRELIYPYETRDENIQDLLINSILENDENSSGDGAFSLAALKNLHNQYLEEFEPVSEVLYHEFMSNEDMAKVLKKVKQKDIMIFNHSGAKIILIKPKKDWQLLFWENLNNLI